MNTKYYFVDESVLLENLEYLNDLEGLGNIVVSAKALESCERNKVYGETNHIVNRAAAAIKYLKRRGDALVYYITPQEVQEVIEKFSMDYYTDCGSCYEAFLFKTDHREDCVFLTNNFAGYTIAKDVLKIDVEWPVKKERIDYTGYKEITMTDEAMAYFYEHKDENIYDVLVNQYLIIKDEQGKVVDSHKWNGHEFVTVRTEVINSNTYGTIKPYKGDIYQRCLLDSLMSNKITMVHGFAGVGKTWLSIGYLLYLLEKNSIDKIIVFTNTTPTLNTARLGFYPGTRNMKLSESSIGNILSSKLGSELQVDRMLETGKLLLIPMCDIRGFDTTGMNAGVLITEAQNLDIYLMKLALQRIGEDSICIIDGDYNAQVDNEQYAGAKNGMRRLSEVFRGQDIYGEVMLKNIYRSRIAGLAEQM